MNQMTLQKTIGRFVFLVSPAQYLLGAKKWTTSQ